MRCEEALSMDMAGKKYWDNAWSKLRVPDPVNPRQVGVKNYINRKFHIYFNSVFNSLETNRMKLLEIGSARSTWLPYFAKEFGFSVYGIDYSEVGCELARRILRNASVEGEVICADFFLPPEDLLEKFDVVVSFGVAEHFQDTDECIAAFSKFIKPGGLIITNIPNMTGLIGKIQRLIDYSVYKIHVILTPEKLHEAHENSGLKIISCGYFISINFGILNINGVKRGFVYLLGKILIAMLSRVSMVLWFFEDKLFQFKATKRFSPYIMCLAKKNINNVY